MARLEERSILSIGAHYSPGLLPTTFDVVVLDKISEYRRNWSIYTRYMGDILSITQFLYGRFSMSFHELGNRLSMRVSNDKLNMTGLEEPPITEEQSNILKLLIRRVIRAFYPPEYIVLVDYLSVQDSISYANTSSAGEFLNESFTICI
jgi:hypothetical protein